jgi:type I restriction-modification system DNA methylase subunit
MSSKKVKQDVMTTELDRLCFQIKDILRNYGKQQTSEGIMIAEVLIDYLMFIKFFEPYDPELHGDKRLKIYDEFVNEFPDISQLTLKSIMKPYLEKKKNKKSILDTERTLALEKERELHDYLSKIKPTSFIFSNTISLYERISHDECAIKILEIIHECKIKFDDIGDIHEYFIQDEEKKKSKMYGQFFTPNEMCLKAIEIVNPTLRPDGSIPDCIDPAAGSFKFMRNFAKYMSQTTNKSYDEILLNHCYGCEIERKAYRSLLFNIIMETGNISKNIYNVNSLKYLMYGKVNNDDSMSQLDDYDINKRYDYLFANPPFGTKTILEMITRDKTNKVDKKTKTIGGYPMKTLKLDGMFLQLFIHLLKDGGEACIVLSGSMFNKDWIPLRKYWMETCDIKSITVCPTNSFKNTSIVSYLIHFKKGGKTTNIEYSYLDGTTIGKRDEFNDTYDISVPDVTKNELPQTTEQHTLIELCDINIKKADRNKYNEYRYIEISSINEQNNVIPSTIQKNELPSRAQLFANIGDILFGSVRPNLKRHIYVDEKLYSENMIVSTGFFVLTPKNNIDSYLLYNMLCSEEFADKCMSFASKKAMYPSVNKEDISKLTVNIPSFDHQNYISQQLKQLDNNIELTRKKIEADKEYMRILLEVETLDCETVKIRDVCQIKSGKAIAKAKLEKGDIPIWGGGIKPMGFTNQESHKEGTIIIAKDGTAGYCHRLKTNSFLTGSANYIYNITDRTNADFLYFCLKYRMQNMLFKLKGNPVGTPHCNPGQILEENIPLPTIEKQHIIITECKKVYNIIQNNELTINKLETLKQRLITIYLS